MGKRPKLVTVTALFSTLHPRYPCLGFNCYTVVHVHNVLLILIDLALMNVPFASIKFPVSDYDQVNANSICI